MSHFLLVYNRKLRRLASEFEFDDSHAADARIERSKLEIEFRNDPNIEVVLLSAESHEALRGTHGRYFKTFQQIAAEL